MKAQLRIIWAPLAVERLEEATNYIRRDRPEAARRWAEQLFARIQHLQQYPESGRVVPELQRKDIREIIHASHRVIYRISKDKVRILTIRHCARQLKKDLARRLEED